MQPVLYWKDNQEELSKTSMKQVDEDAQASIAVNCIYNVTKFEPKPLTFFRTIVVAHKTDNKIVLIQNIFLQL